MLDKIKILLNLSDVNQDDLLDVLIGICKDEAMEYCNLNVYSSNLDSAVIQMVIERYNRIGTEGVTSVSSSGIKEEYSYNYSQHIINKLKKNRKVKCV